MSNLEQMRALSQRALLALACLHVPLAGAVAWAAGTDPLLALGVTGALAGLAMLGAGSAPHKAPATSPTSRALLAIALMGQVGVLVGALSGSAWQVDGHMYFFAVLGMLIALVDMRALIAGAGLVAVHHLGLNFLAPELIYPGGSDFGRTVMHAAILIAMTAAAVAVAVKIEGLFATSEAASAQAGEAAQRAEAALAAARAAEADAASTRSSMAAQLQAELGAVVTAAQAGDFTRRVGVSLNDPTLDELATQVNALIGSVDQGLSETRTTLSAFAAGDLTARMRGDFQGGFAELQRDLNGAIEQLAGLVGRIQDSAGSLRRRADGLQADGSNLAGQAELQATSLQETAATMEEMSANTNANAENAQKASGLASEAQTRARRGQEIVGQAVAAVNEIEASSAKISDIIAVIDGIAFQTNLLALNAAVEAARAGEAGKGFAVVASEVRTLSQRSSDAARDIKALISESTDKVTDGAKLVHAAGGALEDILQSVVDVAATVEAISAASQEQSSGIAEISAAIAQMDQTTQSNAGMAEQSAAAARGLTDEAGQLGALVAGFRGAARSAAAQSAETISGGEARADAAWIGAESRAAPRAPAPAHGSGEDGWSHF